MNVSVDAGVLVRAAVAADVPAVVVGVVELLGEIGRKPSARERLEAAASELIADPRAGVVLVAEERGQIVGVLGASWQSAIRIPGRYGLIQELWVAGSHRSRNIGARLIGELVAAAQEQNIERLEVGLPGEHYPNVAATKSFYAANEFTMVGTRMRRQLR